MLQGGLFLLSQPLPTYLQLNLPQVCGTAASLFLPHSGLKSVTPRKPRVHDNGQVFYPVRRRECFKSCCHGELNVCTCKRFCSSLSLLEHNSSCKKNDDKR